VLKPLFEIAHLLAEGRLVEVLPDAPPQAVTLGLLYPTRRMLAPRTKSFIELAVEELRRHLNAQLALVKTPKADPVS
jgi:DNA-binding transcriptional LysR family regulator